MYLLGREWCYKNIDRKLIVEKFLEDSDNSFNELNINPPNYAIIIQQNNYFQKKTKYDFTNNNIKSFYKPKYIPRLTNQYCIIS